MRTKISKRRVYRWYVKLQCCHAEHYFDECPSWLCLTNRGYDTNVIEEAYSWKTKKEAESHAVLAAFQRHELLNRLEVVRVRYC